jgi:23S rRNA (uracil1939-C5)-methyltransferase
VPTGFPNGTSPRDSDRPKRVVELVIDRLATTGEGVAHFEHRSVFVAGALPGEKVMVEMLDSHAKLLGVLEPNPHRVKPNCALVDRCGGCDWKHLVKFVQPQAKQDIAVGVLEHMADLGADSYELLPPLVSSTPSAQRRRATLHVVGGILGFFSKHSHSLTPIEECPALIPELRRLPGILQRNLTSVLRDLEEIRLLCCAGLVSIALKARQKPKPKLLKAALQLVKDSIVDGVVVSSREAPEQVELLGQATLEEDHVFHRPDGFSQSHAEVNRLLLTEVVERLALGPDARQKTDVLELFSGNGNFTLRVADLVKSVVAVESSALGIRLAQKGLQKAALRNVKCIQNDAREALRSLVQEHQRFECILLDPPRAGCANIGAFAQDLLAQRVVYVSCDLSTLARDTKDLMQHGFKPLTFRIADQFEDTHHVESVMSFSR